MTEYEILPPEGSEDSMEDILIKEDRQRRISESKDRMYITRLGRLYCTSPLEVVFEEPYQEDRVSGFGRTTYHRVGVCQLTLAPGVYIRVMYEDHDKSASMMLLEDEIMSKWGRRNIGDTPLKRALKRCFTEIAPGEEE